MEAALIECGFSSPFRVDHVEHAGKIDDEIITRINQSSLMIVDLTCRSHDRPANFDGEGKVVEARGGVYFEAGYALGLGVPIIWTCRNDGLDHVHFDTRQYNYLVWHEREGGYFVKGAEGERTLKDALVNRISALKLNRKISY